MQRFDFLQHPRLLFFLLFLAQRLPIFFHQRRNFRAIQIEERRLLHFRRFRLAVPFIFKRRLHLGPGVILLHLVDRFLVRVDLQKQFLQIRQHHLRLLGKIESALTHALVDRRPVHHNLEIVVAAPQRDLVRHLHPIHRAIILVPDFLLHAANQRRFLHDQMRLRVEKYLPLCARRRSHFQAHRIPPAHLRIPHIRHHQPVFLRIQQPRIVKTRRRLHLQSLRPHQSSNLPARIFPPRRFPVERLNPPLVPRQHLRVIPVRQFRLERIRRCASAEPGAKSRARPGAARRPVAPGPRVRSGPSAARDFHITYIDRRLAVDFRDGAIQSQRHYLPQLPPAALRLRIRPQNLPHLRRLRLRPHRRSRQAANQRQPRCRGHRDPPRDTHSHAHTYPRHHHQCIRSAARKVPLEFRDGG